ncbi:MAG: NADH-quinone oxidoreductase subunit J [Gammaproteobacteria bacterium]|nr:NADH-quinone oxidoreductase subunit J [Gammaproteobacteria bacterium]
MREYLFQTIFYISAALCILGAALVVLQKNPVRAVLSLVFSFFMMAIIWLMANAEFLALVLVLVYVGAVMTLFLFVVMMLDIDKEMEKSFPVIVYPIAILLLMVFLGMVWYVMPADLLSNSVETINHIVAINPEISNTQQIGQVLFTDYISILEIIAVLLLVAIIASITLVHRRPRHIKRQNIREQIMVKKANRLKIIKSLK